MLGGRPGQGWRLCFPLWLHAGGSGFGLYGGSHLGACWWDGGGLVLWLFVGPAGVCLLDFFCSGVRFCLLLGPCLCFISLLCLGLCVLGDGGFWVFRAGQVSVCLGLRLGWGWVWHGWALRWGVLLTVPGRCFFCGSFVFLFCLVFAVSLCVSVCVCFVVAFWGFWPLGSRLWCLAVGLSLSLWCPGSGVVLDCINSWSLRPCLL